MYKITPGIAAIVYVDYPDTVKKTFVYLAEGKPPVSGPDESVADFFALPLAVQAAINRHFSIVFSLSVGLRAAYLKNFQQIEAE